MGRGSPGRQPDRSPGGKFKKKGSGGKRRSSGAKLPLKDGNKGKRGSRSTGETKRARHWDDGPAKKMKTTWQPRSPRAVKSNRLWEEIRPHQGRARGLWETAAFCSLVMGLFFAHQNGALDAFVALAGEPDWSRCYNLAADMLGMSHTLARTTFNWFYDRDGRGHQGGEILVAEHKRGRGSDRYNIQDARLLKPEHHDAIEAFILSCHGEKGGGRVTLATIKEHLREKFSAPVPEGAPAGQKPVKFEVSRDVIRYCLRHQLGYHWGKIRLKKSKGDADRPATLRSYLLRYSQALALEKAEKAVIVYFDEVCPLHEEQLFASVSCSCAHHSRAKTCVALKLLHRVTSIRRMRRRSLG
jgi:hypothetical protein